jgi:hypothetical protein
MYLSFLALEGSKSYEIELLKPMRDVQGKCKESNTMLGKQSLGILVVVGTAVVTGENAGENLKFQALPSRREGLKDNKVQEFCEHKTGHLGCLI